MIFAPKEMIDNFSTLVDTSSSPTPTSTIKVESVLREETSRRYAVVELVAVQSSDVLTSKHQFQLGRAETNPLRYQLV